MPKETEMKLLPFQQEVFNQMLKEERKRVILQAPTGAGKTFAALAPFVHHLGQTENRDFRWERLPVTCRYAVPTRTLVNQFYRANQHLAENIDQEKPTRLENRYERINRPFVSIQTGDQSDDPQMESALTFCTIDQLLASSIAIPYSLGKSLANINVGAVAGSYLVLDEFHLYPLVRGGKSVFGALTTTIKLLSLLKETTPFVLMTATFSTSLLTTLARLLDARPITLKGSEQLSEVARERVRTFERTPHHMTAQRVLQEHNLCSLVICNTVARSQQMYRTLREEIAKIHEDNIEVYLLHSRFSDSCRDERAREIEQLLGPAPDTLEYGWKEGVYQSNRSIILVATQVVEVGLNISVETLHTEIAPANSIIQRAGRCARFEKQHGRVIVYQIPQSEGKEKRRKYLPYDADLCDATWDALEMVHQQEVDFEKEQKLIDIVHKASDEELLKAYDANEKTIFSKMVASFTNKDDKYSVSSELIRDVEQVQIIIHDHPEEVIKETPWLWQSFSLHPRTLEAWWKRMYQSDTTDEGWICKKAEIREESDIKEPENKLRKVCQWTPITNSAQITTSPIVAIPSRLASYDDEIGFVLLDGTTPSGTYQSVKRAVDGERKSYQGSVQRSYQEHISGLLWTYEKHLHHETQYIAAKLERAMTWPKGIIDQAIRLAIVCHDIGKLDEKWQQWARAWQTLAMKDSMVYQRPERNFVFAKTENNGTREHRELQKSVYPKRPHHACESIKLSRLLIGKSLEVDIYKNRNPLLRAVAAAIAHHHTSHASEYGASELVPMAKQALEEVLHDVSAGQTWKYSINDLDVKIKERGTLLDKYVTIPEDKEVRENVLETLLYYVVVRALRLADQHADLFGKN